MATVANRIYKPLIDRNCNYLKCFLQQQSIILNNVRQNHMFRYLAKKKNHGNRYSYEESRDPKEWEFVEKLMPLETVPLPQPRSNYSSGWRPSTDEALKHPYYVERTKNHMLPVYLKLYQRGQLKVTKIPKIHGDLWSLHNELKDHIEKQIGKKIASYVHEGNMAIHFKGDHVYYAEQWLLSKGF